MSRTPSLVIGLSGCRQVGKDGLFRSFHSLNNRCYRKAFADRLKEDVEPLIRAQFGFDPKNLAPAEKEIVRSLYIGYGMAWRAADPLHWVKIVSQEIDQIATIETGIEHVAVVCDFRFENECQYFRDRYGNAFRQINVTRIGSPPPTDEEEKHFRKVAAMADYSLNWGNDTEEQQLGHARRVLEWVGLSAQ